MVNEIGLGLGLLLTVSAVILHFSRGTEWAANEDISQELLERRAESVPETDFPEPMNRAIGGGGGAGAVAAGEAGGELAEGEEGGAEESSGPGDIPEDEVEHYEIEFVKEGETIEVANNETLLDAGEEEGWDLPYACREGQCLSCAGHVADGPAQDYIRHANNEMLDDAELEEGYVLTCTACPTDDFSIETSEAP